tara:strand:- start:14 stop:421 length:408 start_codon:yes stop_codon:yes gene_type:complete
MDLPKRHKSKTICKWKRSGVIHNDIDILYKKYINTFNCQHCHKEFKNTRDRHLDHCHITGEFRKIVCQQCNTYDSYINYPDGIPSKNERNKIYQEKNKEKLHEKFDCECGGKYIYKSKSIHFRSKKHINWIDNNM